MKKKGKKNKVLQGLDNSKKVTIVLIKIGGSQSALMTDSRWLKKTVCVYLCMHMYTHM